MLVGTILLIVLDIILLGGFSGGLGLVLVIVLFLVLLGRF